MLHAALMTHVFQRSRSAAFLELFFVLLLETFPHFNVWQHLFSGRFLDQTSLTY